MTGPTAPTAGRLPPQDQLARVVATLGADLATHWQTVLADARWAEVDAALARLAVPGAVARLARELGDVECERIAGLLMERWAAVGEPRLPPAASIVARVSGAGGATLLTVVVDGLEPGWTTSWHGPVEPLEDPDGAAGATARLVDAATSPSHVAVRVFGRTSHGRTILTAEADLVPPVAAQGGAQRDAPE